MMAHGGGSPREHARREVARLVDQGLAVPASLLKAAGITGVFLERAEARDRAERYERLASEASDPTVKRGYAPARIGSVSGSRLIGQQSVRPGP